MISNKKCNGNNKTTETEKQGFSYKDNDSKEKFDEDLFF